MLKQNQKRPVPGKGAIKASPLQNRLNLKPNEAYEPGFGKYTLTESELRAGEINKQEVSRFSGKKGQKHTTEVSEGNLRQPNESQSTNSKYNEPGVSQYPGEPEIAKETERKIRDENTKMHNNW